MDRKPDWYSHDRRLKEKHRRKPDECPYKTKRLRQPVKLASETCTEEENECAPCWPLCITDYLLPVGGWMGGVLAQGCEDEHNFEHSSEARAPQYFVQPSHGYHDHLMPLWPEVQAVRGPLQRSARRRRPVQDSLRVACGPPDGGKTSCGCRRHAAETQG